MKPGTRLFSVAVASVALLLRTAISAAAHGSHPLRIQVLSGRADLVSGGEALVQIAPPSRRQRQASEGVAQRAQRHARVRGARREGRNMIDDPDYAPVAADLRRRLQRWMVQTSDPLLDGPVPAPAGAWLNAQDQLSAGDPTHRPNADVQTGVTVSEG